jgi:hypothetical protein
MSLVVLGFVALVFIGVILNIYIVRKGRDE